MPPRGQKAVEKLPITHVWFILVQVDNGVLSILRSYSCADMPSNRPVFRFLEAVKTIHRRLLADVDISGLTAWKQRTPQPMEEIDEEYLAQFNDLIIPEEEEDEGGEDEDDEGDEDEEVEEEENEDEEEEVARALPAGGNISLHLQEVPDLDSRIRVLVHVPSEAGGTSCRVVSTRCISTIKGGNGNDRDGEGFHISPFLSSACPIIPLRKTNLCLALGSSRNTMNFSSKWEALTRGPLSAPISRSTR